MREASVVVRSICFAVLCVLAACTGLADDKPARRDAGQDDAGMAARDGGAGMDGMGMAGRHTGGTGANAGKDAGAAGQGGSAADAGPDGEAPPGECTAGVFDETNFDDACFL